MISEKRRAEIVQSGINKLNRAESAIERARKALAKAELRKKKAEEQFAASRPLTESEREGLAKRVEAGLPLCCEDGLKWLLEYLPAQWAHAINSWGHTSLGCHKQEASVLIRYASRVRALKLNRFPD